MTFVITRYMKLVEKKEFVATAIDLEYQTLVVSIVFLAISNEIKFSCKLQIIILKIDQTSTIISPEYSNFVDVFPTELAIELPEHRKINNHVIDLMDGKKPLYRPIYSLEPIKWEIWMIYIETNLPKSFMKSFKSPVDTPILVVSILDDRL